MFVRLISLNVYKSHLGLKGLWDFFLQKFIINQLFVSIQDTAPFTSIHPQFIKGITKITLPDNWYIKLTFPLLKLGLSGNDLVAVIEGLWDIFCTAMQPLR